MPDPKEWVPAGTGAALAHERIHAGPFYLAPGERGGAWASASSRADGPQPWALSGTSLFETTEMSMTDPENQEEWLSRKPGRAGCCPWLSGATQGQRT